MAPATIHALIPSENFANQPTAWFNGFKEGIREATEYGNTPKPVNLMNAEKLLNSDRVAAAPRPVASCSCPPQRSGPSFSYPTGYVGQAILVLCYAPLAYQVGKTLCNVADKYFAYQKSLAELRATKELLHPHREGAGAAVDGKTKRKRDRRDRANYQAAGTDNVAAPNLSPFDFTFDGDFDGVEVLD